MSERPSVDPDQFRRAMSEFATGVTVVMVQRGDRMHGMTANAFTSLSLDPPLVLFCVGKQARMATFLEGAQGFVINVLSADQESVSNHFAGRPQFTGEDIGTLRRGPIAPMVPGALVSISCELEELHEGGDHWIVVGRVVRIDELDSPWPRPPLVYFRSRYASLFERPSVSKERITWSNDAIRIYHDEWSVNVDEAQEEEYVRAHIW